ncbi:MAG: helix-turn-helix domain-containing protein [Oscillospiraceae bacterium]
MENSELILNFIEKRNISCYKIAQSTGISESTFSKWKVKPTSKVDLSIVQKIAAYFNTTVDSILDSNQPQRYMPSLSDDELELFQSFNRLSDKDKGKVMERAETLAELAAERVSKERAAEQPKKAVQITASAADEQPEPEDDEPEQLLIKIMHSFYKVSAGRGFDLSGDEDWEEIEIPDTHEARKADYALTIQGDSMEPIYYDGDIVLVKKQDAVEIGQVGIFVLDGSGFIKKYNGDRLISLNEKYDDILLEDYNDCRCDGRVIGRV